MGSYGFYKGFRVGGWDFKFGRTRQPKKPADSDPCGPSDKGDVLCNPKP